MVGNIVFSSIGVVIGPVIGSICGLLPGISIVQAAALGGIVGPTGLASSVGSYLILSTVRDIVIPEAGTAEINAAYNKSNIDGVDRASLVVKVIRQKLIFWVLGIAIGLAVSLLNIPLGVPSPLVSLAAVGFGLWLTSKNEEDALWKGLIVVGLLIVMNVIANASSLNSIYVIGVCVYMIPQAIKGINLSSYSAGLSSCDSASSNVMTVLISLISIFAPGISAETISITISQNTLGSIATASATTMFVESLSASIIGSNSTKTTLGQSLGGGDWIAVIGTSFGIVAALWLIKHFDILDKYEKLPFSKKSRRQINLLYRIAVGLISVIYIGPMLIVLVPIGLFISGFAPQSRQLAFVPLTL